MNLVQELRSRRREKYGEADIREFTAMFKEGITNKIPPDIAPFLVKHVPQNDDELSFWIHECLEKQGLTCYFTREPNHLQTDLQGTCSHMEFMCDAFFDRAGDCIVLGNRASSKTLCFAAMLLIESVLKPGIELAHLGAIEDQAKRCYRYFRKMTDHPLFSHLLARQPTSTRVELVNGSSVEILVGTMSGVNCFHGDTLIECARDVRKYPHGIPIRELVDKEVIVPTIHEKTGEVQYRKARGLYSGKSKCVKVTVSSRDVTGKDKLDEIICTPHQRFLMLESHKYKQAGNLKPGDRLVPFDSPYVRDVEAKTGIKDSRFAKERRILLQQSWDKHDVVFRAEHREIAKALFGENALEGKVVHHKDGCRLNNSPDNLELMDALEHHKHHFGEDCQDYITPESLKKMSKSKTINNVDPVWQDKEWLKNQILEQKTLDQIASELGVHGDTIRKWVRIHDLRQFYEDVVPYDIRHSNFNGPGARKVCTQTADAFHEEAVWRNADWLNEQLRTKTVQQVAEDAGCNPSTIRYWCTALGVEVPASKYNRFVKHAYDDVEALKADVASGLTYEEIANKYNTDRSVIANRIQKYNLGQFRPDPVQQLYQDKDWLQEQVDKGLSHTQIAKVAGCAQTVVSSYIRQYGIKSNIPEPLYHNKEFLEQKIREGVSMSGLAKELGCSLCAIQKGIKRVGLYDLFLSLNEKKHLNREWLIEQLRAGRTVTEIGRDAGCTQSAVSLQMKKFGFTAKQVRDNPEAYYENHVVVSVEFLDEEYDVYDLSITTLEEDGLYRHNFPLPSGVFGANSPHPQTATLDEVELIDWAILQEAFNMARSGKGYKGSTRLTSTRKKASGTMQRLLDEATQRGLKIYKWNLWDTIQTCPLTENDMGQITDQQELYTYLNGKGEPSSCFVYSSCMNCPMLPACRGQAKTSNAGPNGVVKIEDAIKNFKTLDKEVWDAQVICVKPGRSNLIYSMFEPDYHVVDFTEMLKEKYGEHYEHSFDTDLEVYAGQDAGFGCPATVFLQVIDDPETGEQTVVIFDELYEKNIAPSKYVAEFLLPKHDLYNVVEWFCDPSNSQQLMAEMELQDLYTVPGLKNVDEGIDAVKALFSMGKLLIDKRCKNLIWELGRYEKGPNGKPKKVDDHLCDATRFGVMGVGIYDQTLSEVYK